MQEGGKIAVAVTVTFTAGVVAGWLLNTYTRKARSCMKSLAAVFFFLFAHILVSLLLPLIIRRD